MSIQIVYNIEELHDLCSLAPYTVRAVTDPAAIVFPAVVKFILINEYNEASATDIDNIIETSVPIVYAVIFDAGDILDFYDGVAVRIMKPGIEGFNYAESTENDQGSSGVVQPKTIDDYRQTDTDDNRRK
jgi:hypothetical protein